MFLDVAFSPRTLGDHVGTLWVQSDTPAGTTQASVIGACAPKPIAVCEVTPEEIEPHSEAATWLGEDSYDPSGATIVEYEWTLLQKPLGSTSFIPNGGANRPNFSPDLYLPNLCSYLAIPCSRHFRRFSNLNPLNTCADIYYLLFCHFWKYRRDFIYHRYKLSKIYRQQLSH